MASQPPNPPRHNLYGRRVLDDLSKCSRQLLVSEYATCTTGGDASVPCGECDAAHYCSPGCRDLDATEGWHALVHRKSRALKPAESIYLPYYLANELRAFASQRALDMIGPNPSDVNRPIIAAILCQLGNEEAALQFISSEMWPSSALHLRNLLHPQGDYRTSPAEAQDMAGRKDKGLAYAAVVTLIKMCRYRDIMLLYQHYEESNINPNLHIMRPGDDTVRKLQSGVIGTSNMANAPECISHADCIYAENDFQMWLNAVKTQRPDFWEVLLNAIGRVETDRRALAGELGEQRRKRAADLSCLLTMKPFVTPIDAVKLAFPAWWAASAPKSGEAAKFLKTYM